MPNPAAGLLALLGTGAALIAAAIGEQPASAAGGKKTVTLDPNLPATLATQVVSALSSSRDPKELNALADELDKKGYPMAAAALRKRAAELGASPPGVVPTPSAGSSVAPPTNLPGLDPGIDDATSTAVLTALSTETDPAKLAGFAHSIQDRYPIAAAALLSKAASLLAAENASNTIAATDAGVLPSQTTVTSPTANPESEHAADDEPVEGRHEHAER